MLRVLPDKITTQKQQTKNKHKKQTHVETQYFASCPTKPPQFKNWKIMF